MKLFTRLAAILVASLAVAGAAFAQTAPTLTFTAENVAGVESVVPKLTWSTSPAAASCTASGDWTGTKAASGTESLPAITQSKTYNLSCTWPSGTTASLTWVPPTTNTDGSALTNLASYNIKLAKLTAPPTSDAALTQSRTAAGNLTTVNVTGLTVGTWYFCMQAVNTAGASSVCSNIASKTFTDSAVSRSVGIVVNPRPSPPTGLTVE